MIAEALLGLGAFVAACCLWKRPRKICGRSVLVVGGTSGLGLELAKLLHRRGNTVTITSRTRARAERAVDAIMDGEVEEASGGNAGVGYLEVDTTADKDLAAFSAGYDYIFCIPGFCTSKYFEQQDMGDFTGQMDLNFMAAVRLLSHFQKHNGRPFTFLVVSSTVAWLPFPGYSSYAPTKSALSVFASCAGPELARRQIDLRVFACPTMDTPALARENRDKPSYTWEIECSNRKVSPGDAARFLLDNMQLRRVIAMDWFTYFNVIKNDCECMADYMLFPVAVAVVFAAKCYIRWSFPG